MGNESSVFELLRFYCIGTANILLNDVEQFEQIDNTPSIENRWETPMWNLVKIGQAVSEKKRFKDEDILYIYIAKEQVFATFIIYCKFQPLIFNTLLETVFWIYFPYKYKGTQIWHCSKRFNAYLGSSFV